MRKIFPAVFLLLSISASAQKKPLDHTVYDNWKSIGERLLSNDGTYIVYTVNPQEGDGELVIQNPSTRYKKSVPRGYNAVITDDSRYLIFKIKPFFQDTRQAKIKKKTVAEMPKDSLGIIELGNDSIIKIAAVKSFKVPEKGESWLAYELEKMPDTPVVKSKRNNDSLKIKKDMLVKLADSVIRKAVDSVGGNISREKLTALAEKAAKEIIRSRDVDEFLYADAEGDDSKGNGGKDGSSLVIRKLTSGWEKKITGITDYLFDKKGNRLLLEIARNGRDSTGRALVVLYKTAANENDTVMQGFNDARSFAFDEEGIQLSFVAERDSSDKALTKFYKLWYYKSGKDSASLIADKNTAGMQLGYTVSENAQLIFSKDGSKLFFGTAPIRTPKDTTLVDFETARLDIWHYKDDYLQTQQLKNLDAELKRSYAAVYHVADNKLVQLGAEDAERITLVNEGNAPWVLAESDKGNRIEAQWTGRTKTTAFVIDVNTGDRTVVFKNGYANAEPSPSGKFVYWYDPGHRHYFTYEVTTALTRNVSGKIKWPLYDEENDVPDFPQPYGVMGWQEGDSLMYVYDQYDAWKCDPLAKAEPELLNLPYGRKNTMQHRYVRLSPEERFLKAGTVMAFRVFNKTSKENSYHFYAPAKQGFTVNKLFAPLHNCGNIIKAKQANRLAYTVESYADPVNMFTSTLKADTEIPESAALQLSDINPQQKEYNWGTASLYSWKAYNGKNATGILYKPEDYDPKKRYPLICYFYEKLSDGLYNYMSPAPTPSRLNISFFVSRGYIVLAPDIEYAAGHPGNSAYDYIASGARALVKAGMADSTKIGIQGQSWGGYQVAYLITKTKMFKAAWAGAPVANMTSAYGGIRWESGLNRQFQYEKQQSRIGAALWDKPQLYIENSPLFHLPKVNTPLVIMHNDADGAVPWYQGIELFTALRRLDKPVWMLNYNGEAHNLIERRNRKDIQVREQQFFDWLLKGEKTARWITDGVPATEKGKSWGLEAN